MRSRSLSFSLSFALLPALFRFANPLAPALVLVLVLSAWVPEKENPTTATPSLKELSRTRTMGTGTEWIGNERVSLAVFRFPFVLARFVSFRSWFGFDLAGR